MNWEQYVKPYAKGELLMLGKWNVGGVHYNDGRPKNDPLMYVATCRLPGLKSVLGHFETDKEAKEKVESVVRYWLREIPEIILASNKRLVVDETGEHK